MFLRICLSAHTQTQKYPQTYTRINTHTNKKKFGWRKVLVTKSCGGQISWWWRKVVSRWDEDSLEWKVAWWSVEWRNVVWYEKSGDENSWDEKSVHGYLGKDPKVPTNTGGAHFLQEKRRAKTRWKRIFIDKNQRAKVFLLLTFENH